MGGFCTDKEGRGLREERPKKNVFNERLSPAVRGGGRLVADEDCSQGGATIPEKRLVADREASEVVIGGRRVLSLKKKKKAEKRMLVPMV